MTALTIAAPARRDFVLQPAWSSFDPGDDVLGRRRDQALKTATAPHAGAAITLQDDLHTVPPVHGGMIAYRHAALAGR